MKTIQYKTLAVNTMKIPEKATSERKCPPIPMRTRPARPPINMPPVNRAVRQEDNSMAREKNTIKIDEDSPLTNEQLRSQALPGTRAGVNFPLEPNCSV